MVEETIIHDNCGNEIYFEVLKYFGHKERNVNLSTVSEFTENLNSDGLSYYIYVPFQFFINPIWLKYISNLTSKANLSIFKQSRRGVLVHYSTCKQCYKVNDIWLHFTCEVYEGGKVVKYVDPYESKVRLDYPSALQTRVDHDELFKLNHIMIFVYKD